MPYLLAAVVLLGTMTGVNLLLLLGVIRRLRTHTAMLAAGSGGPAAGTDLLPAGERIARFEAVAVDGEPVGRDTLTGDTLVGFMKPACGPCEERMPEFLRLAAATPGGRERVLAVVAGTAEEAAPLLAQLSPVARVVVELFDGPVTRAFGVHGYPTYYLVDGAGTVRSGGYRPDRLMVPASA
jgi:thiol-disulfide isomerase/thioredoxin